MSNKIYLTKNRVKICEMWDLELIYKIYAKRRRFKNQ